jgi:hypothetical protein
VARASSPSGETATTLILVGLIVDVVFEAILIVLGAAVVRGPFGGVVLLALAGIGLLWVVLIYLFSYVRVRRAEYEDARPPTLVFAILSLITLALIPGILFLIAYVKLGDAVREQPATASHAWGAPAPPVPPLPLASAVAVPATRYCSYCGRADTSGGQYCTGCGAPLS